MKAIIAVPVVLGLGYRAYSHNSLTLVGTIVAMLSATAHAVHPWPLPLVLLGVFFLAGTRVTKMKKDVKAHLTIQSMGAPGGEGPRTHIQVLANSGIASVLSLLHAYKLYNQDSSLVQQCYPWGGDLLIVGIIANYAAVAADTFSSELGILSKSKPRLITSPTFRQVPPGTNGGVTLWGLVAGLIGSFVITTASLATLPMCSPNAPDSIAWTASRRQYFAISMIICGGIGSVLDSILGGLFQASVVDTRTGRVVEGEGGKSVLVSKFGTNSMHLKKRAEIKSAMLNGEGEGHIPIPAGTDVSEEAAVDEKLDEKMGMSKAAAESKMRRKSASVPDDKPSRVVESGFNVLDNNEVNFLMALAMTFGAMQVAGWAWGIPLSSIWTF